MSSCISDECLKHTGFSYTLSDKREVQDEQ